jgi:hypothetical protein
MKKYSWDEDSQKSSYERDMERRAHERNGEIEAEIHRDSTFWGTYNGNPYVDFDRHYLNQGYKRDED